MYSTGCPRSPHTVGDYVCQDHVSHAGVRGRLDVFSHRDLATVSRSGRENDFSTSVLSSPKEKEDILEDILLKSVPLCMETSGAACPSCYPVHDTIDRR